MRRQGLARLVAATAAALLIVGCGSQSQGHATSSSSPSSSKTNTMADGAKMTDAEMKAESSTHAHGDPAETVSAKGDVTHRDHGPSQPAGMICSQEVAQAVQRTFALSAEPEARDGWSGHLYTCTYTLPHSELKLSVEDLDQKAAGLAHFTSVKGGYPTAESIKGLENLGFPAFQTAAADGQVGFLKDSKTLLVDAGSVAASDVPSSFSRTEAAYGVAAAVIACWSE